MILEMKVPSPGESITEVEIAEWLVSDGDYVEKDQAIASRMLLKFSGCALCSTKKRSTDKTNVKSSTICMEINNSDFLFLVAFMIKSKDFK